MVNLSSSMSALSFGLFPKIRLTTIKHTVHFHHSFVHTSMDLILEMNGTFIVTRPGLLPFEP
jgi:hypothetical protein